MRIKLIRKTTRCRLTWFSRIGILVVIIIGFLFIFRNLDSFLSISKPIPSRVMVLEGWLPDYTIKEMMELYYDGDYEHLIITGLPTHKGYYVTQFNNSAEIALKTLSNFGFDTNGVAQITIPQSIQIDRTYTTALAVGEYLKTHLPETRSINVFTLGSHARRSRILFDRALRPNIEVGILAADNREYDKNHWWNSSRGFRTVSNEAMGYVFVKLFFHPNKTKTMECLEEGQYIDHINQLRYDKDQEFLDTLQTPLTPYQLTRFTGLSYFEPSTIYRITCSFEIDTGDVFTMKTNTERAPAYRRYGKISFLLDTAPCQLILYQNMSLLNQEEYADYLFIPFRDPSNGNATYGGGRYLDMKIPEGDQIEIDFNLSYNPYCAYNSKWSCPIPPPENHLKVEIAAGEKNFTGKEIPQPTPE